MFVIKRIEDQTEKSRITETILRKLPSWFGNEEALKGYVEGVKGYPFQAAYREDDAIGFISIKPNNEYTSEIYVMGILREHHRGGVGKSLLLKAEEEARKGNYKFLMVKTLGESNPDESYRRTREFYRGVGFYPLEELKEIWDAENPCLIMVKNL